MEGMKRILSYTRRAVDDYEMINDGLLKTKKAHHTRYKSCMMHQFTIAKTLDSRIVESWFPVFLVASDNYGNRKDDYRYLYQTD